MTTEVDQLAVAASAAVTAMLLGDSDDDADVLSLVNALFDDRPADVVFADRRDDLPMGLLLIIVQLLGMLSDATGESK